SITYGEGPDGGLGGTPSASAPALPDATGPATGEPASPAAGDGETVVRYELTVSGRNNIGNVNYTDKDDERISRDGIPLPWSLQFTPVNPDFRPGFYVARTGGGDGGEIRCRTYVGGKMIKEETKRGRGYVAVFC
ncbi:MAG TPA: MmpS family transport accessory protein, partial [Pilimelia sp.]|nr:MmpS family transport accessory protein [Pilimelia sp.]